MESSETTTSAKRDFGSFHSSNVEELIHQSEADYKPPKLDVVFKPNSLIGQLAFGSDELKRCLFNLTEEFCFLNHGAFGLSFRPTIEYTKEWELFAESQPLRFYDRLIIPLLVDLIRSFAKLFECRPDELALVENCTFAFNSVISSMRLQKDDAIVIFSTCYGVYKKILRELCAKSEATLIELKIEFPIKDSSNLLAQTVGQLEQALENDVEKRIKFVIVDHVPSNQPFLMPVREISKVVKSKRSDVVYIVDGAHSIGSVKNFSPSLLGADVFFTNCHKWFCGPKGTALLFRSHNLDEKLLRVRPAVQSHGISSGYNSEFIWSGLKNYSQYLGLYANLKIWELLGGFNRVIDYCHNLMGQAAELLVSAWSTDCLVDPSLCTTMICVRLPDEFVSHVLAEASSTSENTTNQFTYDQAELIQNYFYFRHRIECPIKAIQNQLYLRISCHIYNNIDDYRFLADKVVNFKSK